MGTHSRVFQHPARPQGQTACFDDSADSFCIVGPGRGTYHPAISAVPPEFYFFYLIFLLPSLFFSDGRDGKSLVFVMRLCRWQVALFRVRCEHPGRGPSMSIDNRRSRLGISDG